VNVAKRNAALAYVKGYEDAIEKLQDIIRETCAKRAAEINTIEAIAHIGFTRDRILFAIAPLAEKVAAKRVSLERDATERESVQTCGNIFGNAGRR
jgi:hypothetical protein